MAITKDEIIEAVGNMSVMDLNDLVKAFEEKFGVSAAAMAVASSTVGLGVTLCCIAGLQRHVAVLAAWQLFAL